MMLADVTVPYGEWATNALNVLQPIATLALTGIASYLMAAYLPPWLKMLAGSTAQDRVNQVLAKAVASAIARTQSLVEGKVMTVPIASEIIGKAAQYAVDQAPDLIRSATEGKIDNLMNMILARMREAGIPPVDGEAAKQDAKDKFDFGGAISSSLEGKTPPAKPPSPTAHPVLKHGSQGKAVEELQRKLGIAVDGDFGPTTEQAVKNFQKLHGLTADGVVGQSTWNALGK